MGVNKIINSPVVNKLKICDLKSSRSLKYTAIIIIAITTRVNLFIINYRYNFLHYSVKTFSYKQQVINKSYNLLMQM